MDIEKLISGETPAETDNLRIERDSLGIVQVPKDKYWGAQTQRSINNFKIGVGHDTMPIEVIQAIAVLKKACAIANNVLQPERMTTLKCNVIFKICDEIINGVLDDQFPLVVWQTGSGTQTNMNVNEVIANKGNELAGDKILHPNDDVNMSQSSNDIFPSAMHIAGVRLIEDKLLPAVDGLIDTLNRLEAKNTGVIKPGRTHLQDAVPIDFAQEISGWRTSIEKDKEMILSVLPPLKTLAIGGTAVGTGLNAPKGFDTAVAKAVTSMTGKEFTAASNKFHALSSKDELVFAHGAIKALACDLMKIANDIRWLASGPNLGLGEIKIPANEPGSSIMPGKVNPTQCEQMTMVAVQIMGNDTAVSIAASQGNFQLNVFMPLIIYNFVSSCKLLAESIESFNKNCVSGIVANRDKMYRSVCDSLMLVTALTPVVGYDKAARAAYKAGTEGLSLKQACIQLNILNESDFDRLVRPENLV